MQIDPYLIRYLEKSQRLKFKIIPTFHKTSKNHNFSVGSWKVPEFEKGERGKVKFIDAKIYITKNHFKKGYEKSRDLTILHEARESLIEQNDSRMYKLKRDMTKQEDVNYRTSIHIRAINHEIQDKRFLNEYYKYYKNKGYVTKNIPEMYNFQKYKEILGDLKI